MGKKGQWEIVQQMGWTHASCFLFLSPPLLLWMCLAWFDPGTSCSLTTLGSEHHEHRTGSSHPLVMPLVANKVKGAVGTRFFPCHYPSGFMNDICQEAHTWKWGPHANESKRGTIWFIIAGVCTCSTKKKGKTALNLNRWKTCFL